MTLDELKEYHISKANAALRESKLHLSKGNTYNEYCLMQDFYLHQSAYDLLCHCELMEGY